MMWEKDEILNKLNDSIDNIKVLSLDIFDTILFRACKESNDVFYEVGQRAIKQGVLRNGLIAEEFKEIRIIAQQKARKNAKNISGTEEVDLHDIYNAMPDNIGDKSKLISLELTVEKDICYLNPSIYSLIEYIHSLGKDIILVSDMYLSRNEILNLLSYNGFDIEMIDKIYVSSDYNKSKLNGKLFDLLLKDYKYLKPYEILHIGDNKEADYIVPEKKQINSIYYNVVNNESHIYEYEEILSSEIFGQLNSIRQLASNLSEHYTHDNKEWFNLGASVIGPFLVPFCKWIIDIAVKEGQRKICPLMREGLLLSKILKRMIDELDLDIIVEPIYISRQASVLPSLKKFSLEEIEMFFGRKDLTVKDFFVHIGLENETNYFEEFYDIRLAEASIVEKDLKDEIITFLLSEEINKKIRNNINRKRVLLSDYLVQSFDKEEKVITVDIGFRGTIQKAIDGIIRTQMLPYKTTHLLAFGAEKNKEHLINGIDIRGYVGNCGKNIDLIKRIIWNSRPLEQIMMIGHEGTTIGYSQVNGQVVPSTHKKNCYKEEMDFKKVYVKGIMTYLDLCLCYHKKNIAMDGMYGNSKRNIGLIIYRLLLFPTVKEAQILGRLNHSDNFGSSYSKRICSHKDINKIEEIGISIFHRNLNNGIGYEKVYWPEGILTLIDQGYLYKKYLELNSSGNYLSIMSKLALVLLNKGIKEVALYGAGEVGQSFVKVAKIYNLKILCIIDRKESLWGQTINGIEIVSLKRATNEISICNVVIGSIAFTEIIKENINKSYQMLKKPQIYSINNIIE